jgi:Zn-dependent oligopeptidase
MRNGEWQTPAVALVGNNPMPTNTKPSLLTHNQVSTLFHEFGHVMHAVLTRCKFAMFSWSWSAVPYVGGVELDMLETPSMMLENWPWEKHIIKRLSKHYESGK